jgi:hypothetical protein
MALVKDCPSYKLGELLVKDGVLSQAQINEHLQQQQAQPGARLGQILRVQNKLSLLQLWRYLLKQQFFRVLACLLSLSACPQLVAQEAVQIPSYRMHWTQSFTEKLWEPVPAAANELPKMITSDDVKMLLKTFAGRGTMPTLWRANASRMESYYQIEMLPQGAVLSMHWSFD